MALSQEQEEVAQTPAETDPVREKQQTEAKQEHWVKELEASRSERKNFDESAVKYIQRYMDKRSSTNSIESNRYNLFYANTEIKKAALFSKNPEPDIRRRFSDANDDVSRVAASLLQRTVAIELDTDSFENKMQQIIFDHLVPGVGIGWVRLEETYEDRPKDVKGVDPISGAEIVIGQEMVNELAEQDTPIDYVAWDDFMWSPGQVWTETSWVARRVPMSKEAVEARFGDTCPRDVLDDLEYGVKKGEDKGQATNKLKPKHSTKSTCDVYELWDKESRLVWWISESAELPLDVQEDDKRFPDFFPTPLPPLGRFSTSSTIPLSDFSMCQDLYDQLDSLTDKAANLIETIKVRFVYDAECTEIQDIFKIAENQGLPVKNYAAFIGEKGGIAQALQFVPIDQFVNALKITLENIAQIKQQIFEIEGIADFMRGQTQQYDSAAAISQKGSFAASRLGTEQRMVAKYVEKLVRLKVHLISNFYKPEILVDHAGVIPPDDQKYLGEAVKLLKSNFRANFRLAVSVDSIQDNIFDSEKIERTSLVRAIGELLSMAMPAVSQAPEMAPLMIEVIKFAVAGYKGSESIEGVLDSALQKLQAAQTQGAQQKKPPSKEEIKAQIAAQDNQTKMAIAQMQTQADVAIASSEAQSRATNDQQELEVARMQTQVKATEATAKLLTAVHNQARDISGANK